MLWKKIQAFSSGIGFLTPASMVFCHLTASISAKLGADRKGVWMYRLSTFAGKLLLMAENIILTKSTAEKKMQRMAMEVLERHPGSGELILVGIQKNGFPLAKKIGSLLRQRHSGGIRVIALSIDKKHPSGIRLDPEVSCSGKSVILIDDVANSGRTMLYALSPLLEAYPARIETMALVARTHRTFPVALDYVGLSVSTSLKEHIRVDVEQDDVSGATIGKVD